MPDRPLEMTTPSTAFLDELDAQTAAAAAAAEPVSSSFTGAPRATVDRLEAIVDSLAGEVAGIVRDLHAHPETAFEEHRSAALLAERVRAHGAEAAVGVHGLDTAIRAELVSDGFDPDRHRTVAVLAEYDALPGIGHACGHNVIAASGTGAFLALADLLAADLAAFDGRVVFLGTPAEEGHSGKEHMAAGVAFDGLDAAIMVHGYGYDLADQLWLGRRLLTVVFDGQTAHASAQPFMGRNALDAANLMYQGVGLLRQQIPPTDRIHAILREGGERASVIPERARLDLYVRSAHPATLKDLSARVRDIARGAALMTGTGVEIRWDEHPPSLPVRANPALTGRWAVAQQRRGRRPLPRGVVSETFAASTDFGNVSYRIPGIHPLLKIADPDVALHTRGFADAAGSATADRGAVDGAFGLAATALDFLVDDELADAVRAEFEAAGGAIDVARYFD